MFFTKRTYRIPKDIHVKPEMFAAELINRLEAVLREREAQERLEERLKRVRLVSVPIKFVVFYLKESIQWYEKGFYPFLISCFLYVCHT